MFRFLQNTNIRNFVINTKRFNNSKIDYLLSNKNGNIRLNTDNYFVKRIIAESKQVNNQTYQNEKNMNSDLLYYKQNYNFKSNNDWNFEW